MGHSSVVVTERYAHLRTDLFRDADYSVVSVDLSGAPGQPLRLPEGTKPGTFGYSIGTKGVAPAQKRNKWQQDELRP